MSIKKRLSFTINSPLFFRLMEMGETNKQKKKKKERKATDTLAK